MHSNINTIAFALVIFLLCQRLNGGDVNIASQLSQINPQIPSNAHDNPQPRNGWLPGDLSSSDRAPHKHHECEFSSNHHHQEHHHHHSGHGFDHAIQPHSFSDSFLESSSSLQPDFIDRISVINRKNYFFAAPTAYDNDLKLIQLALPHLHKGRGGRPLNILNVGTGSGYLAIALAVLSSNHRDRIVSCDKDQGIISRATENIVTDGKEYYFHKLHLTTSPEGQIPEASGYNGYSSNSGYHSTHHHTYHPHHGHHHTHHPHHGHKYDIIVLSKAISVNAPFPAILRDNLKSPGGILIYPERDFNGRMKFRLDRLDQNGRLQSERIIF